MQELPQKTVKVQEIEDLHYTTDKLIVREKVEMTAGTDILFTSPGFQWKFSISDTKQD